MDCAHPLVLNIGVPISGASSIMSTYDEATPYVAITKGYGGTWTLPSEIKFAEAIGALSSLTEPFEVLHLQITWESIPSCLCMICSMCHQQFTPVSEMNIVREFFGGHANFGGPKSTLLVVRFSFCKNWLKGHDPYCNLEILACRKFSRISCKIREIRENLLFYSSHTVKVHSY